MDKQQFRWLGAGCEARNGRRLETNQIYEAGDFPAAVLTEWVRSGSAELIQTAKKPRKEGDT
jgi:hypothetical protein